MNEITKETWEKIETEMTHSWVNISFAYKGHEISVQRERESESKTCLAVYINGEIKGAWVSIHNEPEARESRPSVCDDVWCLKTKAKYQSTFIRDVEKIYGKRRAKKKCPDLHSKYRFRWPFFSKSSVLCRQFKKLNGLELIKANFMHQ